MTDQNQAEQGPAGRTAALQGDVEPIGPKLTAEQIQKAVSWLNSRWGVAPCPFHGPTNWEIGDFLVGTVGFVSGGLSLGGRIYPSIVVVCGTCGFTVFVNAIKAGIVPQTPPLTMEPAGESASSAAEDQ